MCVRHIFTKVSGTEPPVFVSHMFNLKSLTGLLTKLTCHISWTKLIINQILLVGQYLVQDTKHDRHGLLPVSVEEAVKRQALFETTFVLHKFQMLGLDAQLATCQWDRYDSNR